MWQQLTATWSTIWQQQHWLPDVLLVVTLCSLVLIVWRLLAKRINTLVNRTVTLWDDALWYALMLPVQWLIILLGLSYIADIFAAAVSSVLQDSLPVVRTLGITVLVAWTLMRFIGRAEQRFVAQNYDATTVNAIAKLCYASVLVVSALAVCQALGVSISGVLAFGGVGGLVVGLAAKDLLANFFGAIVIYFDRPFSVGDWVRSPDRQIEGTVEHIGWRVTRIRTFDKRPLYVPNSIFSSIAVENPSRMTNRRIYETIGVRYADSQCLPQLLSEIEAYLRNHPEIDQQQTLMVNFNQFAPSSLDFFIYTFTKTTQWVRYHAIKQEILLAIMQMIEQHGAQIAYPTQQLHLQVESNSEQLGR